MNRKAQVTIFLIIGLIILALTALVIGVRNSVVLSQLETQADPTVASVNQFYQSCLYESSVQALERLGRQGGYINTVPMQGKIDFFNEAYWYPSIVPSKDFMVSELQTEIERVLPSCLNHFRDVSMEFSVVEKQPVSVTVVIADKDVSISATQPLDITLASSGKRYKLNNFQTTLPVRLKDLYEESLLILIEESNKPFLSERSAELLTKVEVDPTLAVVMPPFDINDRRSSFEDRLYYYMPLVTVKGTYYPPLDEISAGELNQIRSIAGSTPLDARSKLVLDTNYMEEHLTWDVSGLNDMNTRVTVRYWPVFVMSFSDSASSTSGSFSTVNHFYSSNFPLDVELYDMTAYDGKGYSFHFAMPVSIKDNEVVSLS